MDCWGIFPLFIGACNYNCNYETAAALMVNPACECGTEGSAFDCDCRLSIKCQSICGPGINLITQLSQSCCYLIAPNHYAAGFYQPTRVSAGEVRAGAYSFYCSSPVSYAYTTLQLPWVGFKASDCCQYYSCQHCCFCTLHAYLGGNCQPNGWFGFYNMTCCRFCARSGTSGMAGFDMMLFCANSTTCGSFFACSSHCRRCYDLSSGYDMSPYGVARAATYGVAFFAYANRDAHTTYIKFNPASWMNSNFYVCNGCQCTDWEIFRICKVCCCEYPIKFVAHNPKAGVEKTYIMIRSSASNDCGIFEYKWDQWTGYGSCMTVLMSSTDNPGFPTRTLVTCSEFIEKVADFPSAMTAGKYTTPFMCVGCLYRMSPKENPFWSITVYNHTTTEWDRFTSDDLLTWTSVAPDFSWRPTTRAKFEVFDNCVTKYNNNFPTVVPKCGYTDFGVSANNFERTGVVISAGENVTVDNDSTDALTVQVWGYEG